MRPGAQSVTDSGLSMMPMWPAGSLDLQTVVCMKTQMEAFVGIMELN